MTKTKTPEPFRFRPFQKDDLARLAIHEGGVLAWAPGGGKTIAMFTWPQLKAAFAETPCALRTLIVAPESLHTQITKEALEKFGITLRPLKSQADFMADKDLATATNDLIAGRESTVTGWWITSYSQLGFNGGDEWSEEFDEKTGDTLLSKSLLKQRAAEGTVGEYAKHIGHRLQFPHGKIKCVNKPTLATLLTAFGDIFNCVMCDEAVRLKSNDSHTSLGVRQLNPRWRALLSGTPIKNFLDDLFWLAQWATGGHAEPTGRWPYAGTDAAREDFANAHMIVEQNHTREEAAADTGRRRTFKKRIPQLTNVHRLWKLLGPVVIHRRKEDFGCTFMPKTIIPVRVKPGTAQQQVYAWHCQHPPELTKDGKEMNAIAQVVTQLSNLRRVALCPDSDMLQGKRSWTPWTPKLATTLAIIEQQIQLGERVVVMSPMPDWSATLHRLLAEAGVASILLDGNTSPAKRGKLAQDFKDGHYAVLIGGIKSMGEGHSFECASKLILPAREWALDDNDQPIDRVHRINSPKPVTIYAIETENTVDEMMASRYREKSDASGLALHGALTEQVQDEMNLGELLRDSIASFREDAKTIDEQDLEADYESAGKTRLTAAMRRFREFHPAIVPDRTGNVVTKQEVKAAVTAVTGTREERYKNAFAQIARLKASYLKS